MKIKALVLTIILCIIALPGLHAFGLGAQFNFSTGDIHAPGASLLFSPADIAHFAVNWYLDFDNVNIIGLTFDLCPLALPLTTFSAGSINFTLGIGLFTNVAFGDDREFHSGLRLPVGFNLLLGKNALEFFTHVAPSFSVHFIPRLELADPFFPIAAGARFWIRKSNRR